MAALAATPMLPATSIRAWLKSRIGTPGVARALAEVVRLRSDTWFG